MDRVAVFVDAGYLFAEGARNRAMSEAILLSGDEDLRVGVQQAQEYGAIVHLVGIKPARGSQSVALMQEADMTYEWCEPELTPFLTCTPRDVANTQIVSAGRWRIFRNLCMRRSVRLVNPLSLFCATSPRR